MFDLLKKATPPVVVNMAEKAATSLLPNHVIVAKIHDDFDSAAIKAVEEAKKILEGSGNETTRARVQSLKTAGFHNVPLVKNWEADTQKRADSEKRIAVVEKYSQKYPGQKFIFMDQVKEICKKYGLLCVPVSKYKGTVPPKNILEISDFKALPEDCYLEENGWQDRVEFDFTRKHRFRNSLDVQRMYNHGPSFKAVPMFICAPKGDIIINKDDKVSNDVFMTREIKDPIVLHWVMDGFLVVSKWGPEAEDKDLVNEKMN